MGAQGDRVGSARPPAVPGRQTALGIFRGGGEGPPLGFVSASWVLVFEVFCGVAGSAEEFAFVDGGGSSVCPVVDMVDVAVSGWCPAAFALTVAVSGGDGPSLCWGPHSCFPAYV